ncbi:antigen-presenting glycoprotein CD1d isoform X1 [Tupaia chinensis]|uniref:antigen-presenting glycoprotein CD1d isoform X1 n=2 Tax=Tupaia chinensis TaxID=246437 RepID=UPI000703EB0E|nr:antigen-presenting glycoprotein CD1d isoform X1 [Tupaia chinensis]
MACLLFLLLWGLPQIWGSAEVPQRHFPFRGLQIWSFVNSSWMRTDGLAWLGELQTHRWSNDSDNIGFLRPWSRGTFSPEQWESLQHELRVYRSSVFRDVQEFAQMIHLVYPMEIQVAAGCEVQPGNDPPHFHVAYQGSPLLSFQGNSWVPAPEAPFGINVVIQVLNQDRGTKEMLQELLNNTCPQLVRGLLQAGKTDLEKQVKPQAWLSSGPSPGPGRLLLVCHVSGFYPKPVYVMWMRGEQEQPGTQQGDVLPNGDGTWYLRVTLDVAAGEAADLSCRVKHSSLGSQDIILNWGEETASKTGYMPRGTQEAEELDLDSGLPLCKAVVLLLGQHHPMLKRTKF